MEMSWRMAVKATVHCLTGCAIGEVTGMIITTALGLGNAANIIISILLAFVFGYGLTSWPLMRSGMAFQAVVPIALAADTVSIATMEVFDNLTIIVIPKALNATLSSPLFWLSLLASLVVAFVVAVPVNRWLIAHGKGHAVVHGHHHHGQ